MHIQHIKIKGFQGLRLVSMELKHPITLFAGHNGAGKSSLRDAIRLGLTGQASRVTLKKDFKAMIKNGFKKSEIELTTSEGTFNYALPLAKGVHSELEHLPLCLDANEFCGLKPDERRQILFALSDCQASTERVRDMLKQEGCNLKLAELVIPLLRSGFPAAEKEAKERASQARGAWKAVTGETYGKQKAEGWEPEDIPQPVDSDRITELNEQIESNQRALNNLHQSLGNARASDQRIEALKPSAEKMDRIKVKQAADTKSLEEVRERVNQLRSLSTQLEPLPCPCCDALLVECDGKLMEALEVPQASAADLTRLQELEQSLAMLEQTVINNQRDLDTAMVARKELTRLEQEKNRSIADNSPRLLQNDIDQLQQDNQSLNAELQTLKAQQAAHDKLKDAAKQAERYHDEVMQWSAIAEQFAPSGIPGQILSSAMQPFNRCLSDINSLVPEWPPVTMTPDMDILASGRPYNLLSESEQWRVQAVMILTIAQLTGINLAILDRIDVLDPPSRIQLMQLLLTLCEQNNDLQVLILGTLGKRATGLPEAVGEVWLEQGEDVCATLAKAA